jgi:hypothetical protein
MPRLPFTTRPDPDLASARRLFYGRVVAPPVALSAPAIRRPGAAPAMRQPQPARERLPAPAPIPLEILLPSWALRPPVPPAPPRLPPPTPPVVPRPQADATSRAPWPPVLLGGA